LQRRSGMRGCARSCRPRSRNKSGAIAVKSR
jgi:hypothetical protein